MSSITSCPIFCLLSQLEGHRDAMLFVDVPHKHLETMGIQVIDTKFAVKVPFASPPFSGDTIYKLTCTHTYSFPNTVEGQRRRGKKGDSSHLRLLGYGERGFATVCRKVLMSAASYRKHQSCCALAQSNTRAHLSLASLPHSFVTYKCLSRFPHINEETLQGVRALDLTR